MNGYELSRAWFDWCFDNPDKYSSHHTALFLWICDKWNRLGQKQKFGLPCMDTMEVLNIKSKTTYYSVFNDLVSWGFVIVITKSTNQNTSMVVSLNQKMIRQPNSKWTALDSATLQQVDSTVPIVEQQTIEPKTIEQSFEQFWNLYGKKVDRKAVEKKWGRLKESDKQVILLHVPKYVASTPDVKFRKNPETYINDNAWENEIISQTYKPQSNSVKSLPKPKNYQQPIHYYSECLKQGVRPIHYELDTELSDTEINEIYKNLKIGSYAI